MTATPFGRFSVVFRADAGPSIGFGHVSRCLALAAILKENFHCMFAIQKPDDFAKSEISRAGAEIADVFVIPFPDMLTGNEIVVLDGYHFDTSLQQAIKQKGCILVCIDDLHQIHFVADLIINHAPLISSEMYNAEAYTQFALGTDYALIKLEFLSFQRNTAKVEAEKIFICFGGADEKNLTCTILRQLEQLSFSHTACVVIGSSYRHHNELLKLKAELPFRVEIHKNLPAGELAQAMSACEMAVVPASSILYEVMALRIPVISGWYVENQKNIYEGFLKLNAIVGADNFNSESFKSAYYQALNADLKNKLLIQQEKVIDKKSPERLLKLFLSLA